MKKLVVLFIFSLVFTITSISQTPPPPNGGTNPNGDNNPVGGGAPIGSGLIMLIGMGTAYGFHRIKKENHQ